MLGNDESEDDRSEKRGGTQSGGRLRPRGEEGRGGDDEGITRVSSATRAGGEIRGAASDEFIESSEV